MADVTRFLGDLYSSPIYIHSHIRTFEKNVLQEETFDKTLDDLHNAMKKRVSLLIEVFKSEIAKYENEEIDLRLLLSEYEFFKKEVKAFSDFKKSFSKMQVKDILSSDIKLDPSMTLLQFFKENNFPFELEEIYQEGFTVRDAVTSRLAHVMNISTRTAKSGGKDILNIKQKTKNSPLFVVSKQQLERELKLDTITLEQLGITSKRKGHINKKNAEALLKVLRVYSKPHIERIEKIIEEKKEEFLWHLEKATGGLADMDSHIGNATKNIELIKGIGNEAESKNSVTFDKLFKREAFAGKNFKTTLLQVYSKLGYLWEIISLNAFKKALIERLRIDGDDLGITLTSQKLQEQNTSDVTFRSFSNVVDKTFSNRTPFGVSIKSNLKGDLYGSRTFGTDTDTSSHTGLLGDLNPSRILYFLVNYNTLSKFNVEHYKSSVEDEKYGEGINSSSLNTVYEKIAYLLKSNTLIMGLLGNVFASINEEAELYDINKVTSLPILISYPNTTVYTFELLEWISQYSFGTYGASFSLRNKKLEASGASIWAQKRIIIEKMISEKNHRGYGFIKEQLGDVLNLYDKEIPLTVHFNLNVPKIINT